MTEEIVFGIVLGTFIILTIFMCSIPISKLFSSKYSIIITISILVFSILFLIIYYFIYILLLGGKNYKGAFVYVLWLTSVPTVFTTIYLILSTDKQQFVNIFENTIGYLWCKLNNIDELTNIFIFKKEDFDGNEKYYDHYNENKGSLLTLFNVKDNFKNFYKDYENKEKNIFYINKKNTFDFEKKTEAEIKIIMENYQKKTGELPLDYIDDLKNIVDVKNIIGICSWFFISSLFASIISVKILSRI